MKRQGRKPPKRKPRRPTVDDDLAELALALDDNKTSDDVAGWFSIPWRSGWNAARLGWECWEQYPGGQGSFEGLSLRGLLDYQDRPREAYEIAEMHLSTAMTAIKLGVDGARFVVAGLRCIQLHTSNSSGGGHVYNDVLKVAFDRVPSHWPEKLRGEVLRARCLDAIGVSSTLANDHNDRLRRAFTIAWNRGLYQAAYSLPRAS